MTLRSGIRFFGLLVTGLTLATATIEITLRLIAATPLWQVMPVIEASLYAPDTATGYTHRANASGIWRTENRAKVAINEQGFRGESLREPKPAGEVRIAILGDSIVEALQVEASQTLTAVLEDDLRTGGRDIRVTNFGLAGATVAVQRERLATHVVMRRPDIVILLPAIGDFFSPKAADDSAFPAWIPAADGDVVLRHGFRESAGYRFRNSTVGQFYYTLLDHLAVAGLLNNRKNAGFLPPAHAAPAPAAQLDPCHDLGAYWKQFEDPVGWRRVAAYMADGGALARDHGFRLAIALRGLGVDPACAVAVQTQRDAVLQRLAALAAAAQLPLHDMDALVAARLRPGEPVAQLHGFRQRIGAGHLNPRGHQVYAAALKDVLHPLLP